MSTSAISTTIAHAAPSAVANPKSTVHTATSASARSNVVLTALQEATETAAQTAKEARSGDRQAQKLLAKNAAAAATSRPAVNTSTLLSGTIVNTKA